MEYFSLLYFDPLVKKDIEGQIDSLAVFGALNGYSFDTWEATRRIAVNFKKPKKILSLHDYYSLGLTLLLNEEGNKITYVEVTESISLISNVKLLDRSTKFRYKNGELSRPLKKLLEKLGE